MDAKFENIQSLSCQLTEENKKYVIAVANALLFSQKNEISSNVTPTPPTNKAG